MKRLRRRVYMLGGYNTIALGPGRKEFHPKKSRPGIEHYIKEAGQGTLKLIGGAEHIDEGVIGNFMSARYNKQANLPGFIPMIDPKLEWIPCISVEGACGSGGLALATAIKSILAETADVVLTIGVEVQNTVKPIYGADILAGAGWYQERRDGHAHFFPGQFSIRAGVYYEKFGRDKARRAFARWYQNAIENARLCPTAQEYHNTTKDLEALALTEPDPKVFLEHINVYDCSKVTDAACAIAVVSEEGLKKLGISKSEAVEVISFAQVERNITRPPADLTVLETTKRAVHQALDNAGISINDLATVEAHDCFTIAGILSTEAIGFAEHGKGADFVLEGHTARNGKIPFNTTGGLIGWGHPVGATGVHQAVTIWEQLTERAGNAQIKIPENKPFALSINMGGDDVTLVSIVYKRAE